MRSVRVWTFLCAARCRVLRGPNLLFRPPLLRCSSGRLPGAGCFGGVNGTVIAYRDSVSELDRTTFAPLACWDRAQNYYVPQDTPTGGRSNGSSVQYLP